MKKEQTMKIPENVVAFGQTQEGSLKVYMQQGVFKDLLELPGNHVLLGHHSQVAKETCLIISEYLEVEELSADTWEETRAALAKAYPELEIVGWQCGSYDGGEKLPQNVCDIHSGLFSLHYQVAFMVDGEGKGRKFFHWNHNRMEKLPGYYLYDEAGTAISLAPVRPVAEEEEEEEYGPRRNSTTAAVGICIALLGAIAIFLLFFTITLNNKYKAQLEKQEELTEKLEQQRTEIDSLNEQMSYLTELAYSQNNALVTLQQLFNEEGTHDHGAVTWDAYTVQAGDTLESICEAKGMDYEASLPMLLAINGLGKAEDITEGRMLLIPIVN